MYMIIGQGYIMHNNGQRTSCRGKNSFKIYIVKTNMIEKSTHIAAISLID